MAKTKYGKHILKDVFADIPGYTGHSLISHDGELNVDCSMGYHYVSEDKEFENPHSHEFVELLCFLGSDATDIRDLGAEVEVCLGEECEKHLIDSGAVVSIPAGLSHCPITIKNIKRPVVFLEISLSPKYSSVKTAKKIE